MRQLITVLALGMLALLSHPSVARTGPVAPFHKVIISPYIQVVFVQGDQESVTVDNMLVDSAKLHVEVQGGTLRLYLDGAKDIPHNPNYNDGRHLYPDHAVIATVVYRKLDGLSLRGDETFLCKSPLSADKFTLRVYGESTVIFTEVHIAEMHTVIYGESSLNIKAGAINEQYYTCYGEGKINTTAIAGEKARVTAYGDAEVKVNVSGRIKITSFGDARLCYMGYPTIVKGLHFGDVAVQKID
jgi:hypothetical protein